MYRQPCTMINTEAPDTDSPDMEPGAREWRSLWMVMGVQTQNAFNDKVAQFVLIAVSAVFLEGALKEQFRHIVSIMLSLPFVLFAPFAGWISDRFPKRSVLIGCVIVQIVIIAAIAIAFRAEAFWVATFGFFLLAIQSTFFSPAKVGIVKELVGTEKLTMASGLAQMLTIVAIIVGSLVGGYAFEILEEKFGKWDAAFYTILGIGALAILPMICGSIVQKTKSYSSEPLRARLLFVHFYHVGELLKERSLRLTAIGIAYFWFVGSLLALITLEIAADVASKPSAEAAISSTMLGFSGIGIALGSVIVAIISSNRIELGLVPLGGLGMAVTALLASILPPSEAIGSSFNVNLLFLGTFSAMFLVPLNALLQDQVAPTSRGRMLSASALLDSVAAILAIAIQFGFLWLNVPPRVQFLLLAISSVVIGAYVIRLIPRNFVQFMALMVLRSIYKIRPINGRVLPQKGGALLVANHLSYIDSFVISAASDRLVRFVIFDHYMSVKWMIPFLKMFGVIPISPNRAKEAVRTVADAVKAGDLVCIFPEGQLTRSGAMSEIKKGFELMVRQAGAPVIPIYMDDLWGSIFSFERGVFFKKWPYHFPYHLSVHFGDPLTPKEATANRVREVLMDLSAEALNQRKELAVPVEVTLLRALKKRPWRVAMVEYARGPRCLKRSSVFASALELGKRWRRSLPIDQPRIGVVLPNSSTSVLINLGLRLAGRVPVNIALEKTFSEEAMKEAMDASGIRTVISTPKLQELLTTHYWPDTVLDMSQELRFSTTGLWFSRLKAWLWPWFLDWRLAKTSKTKHDSKAPAVAWLADDAGEPQLTEISHRDLLANIEKMRNVNVYRDGDVFYGEPHFASAQGTILSLWYPLLRGMPAVMIPASADATKLRVAIAAEGITWMIADTFALHHLTQGGALPDPSPVRVIQTFRAIEPEELQKLAAATELQVCKCSASNTLGGLLGVSMPDPNADTVTARHQPGALENAVGRLLPGTTARVLAESPADDVTWEQIVDQATALTEDGWIALKGAGLKMNSQTKRTSELIRGTFDVDGFIKPRVLALNDQAPG
jgi:acyl-[acyl-carrier-protein]-phospholipid O-acyltransferase/long-chain-fatty-acid--[acyl-carrier-protein] ligase